MLAPREKHDVRSRPGKRQNPYVVFDDSGVLVVYKPPHWTMTTTMEMPRETSIQVWLGDSLGHCYPYLQEDPLQAGLVQRLDVETSGCVVVATRSETFHRMWQLRAAGHFYREYVALLHGRLPMKHSCGTLDYSLNTRRRSSKVCEGHGQHARTRYQAIAAFRRYPTGLGRPLGKGPPRDYTLLRVRILTGRLHQIRVHLRELARRLGLPVCGLVGDYKYLPREELLRDREFCPRVFLHARVLGFPLPGERRELCRVRCDLPRDLERVLRELTPDDELNAELIKQGDFLGREQPGPLGPTAWAVHADMNSGRRRNRSRSPSHWRAGGSPVSDDASGECSEECEHDQGDAFFEFGRDSIWPRTYWPEPGQRNSPSPGRWCPPTPSTCRSPSRDSGNCGESDSVRSHHGSSEGGCGRGKNEESGISEQRGGGSSSSSSSSRCANASPAGVAESEPESAADAGGAPAREKKRGGKKDKERGKERREGKARKEKKGKERKTQKKEKRGRKQKDAEALEKRDEPGAKEPGKKAQAERRRRRGRSEARRLLSQRRSQAAQCCLSILEQLAGGSLATSAGGGSLVGSVEEGPVPTAVQSCDGQTDSTTVPESGVTEAGSAAGTECGVDAGGVVAAGTMEAAVHQTADDAWVGPAGSLCEVVGFLTSSQHGVDASSEAARGTALVDSSLGTDVALAGGADGGDAVPAAPQQASLLPHGGLEEEEVKKHRHSKKRRRQSENQSSSPQRCHSIPEPRADGTLSTSIGEPLALASQCCERLTNPTMDLELGVTEVGGAVGAESGVGARPTPGPTGAMETDEECALSADTAVPGPSTPRAAVTTGECERQPTQAAPAAAAPLAPPLVPSAQPPDGAGEGAQGERCRKSRKRAALATLDLVVKRHRDPFGLWSD